MCQYSGAANGWHFHTAVEAAGRISHGRQGPRPEAEELLEVFADHRGIKAERVFVGNGSDEGENR